MFSPGFQNEHKSYGIMAYFISLLLHVWELLIKTHQQQQNTCLYKPATCKTYFVVENAVKFMVQSQCFLPTSIAHYQKPG